MSVGTLSMAIIGFVYFEGYQLETRFVHSKFESVQRGQLSRHPLGSNMKSMINKFFVLWENNLGMALAFSIVMIIVGSILQIYGFAYAPAHPINTICLLTGAVIFYPGGFAFLLTLIFWIRK